MSTTCLRIAKVLARLRVCAGSPEPLLVANMMYPFLMCWPIFCFLRYKANKFYHRIRDMEMLIWIKYGPLQAKRCIRTCVKCTDSSSFRACAKSHPGICSPLIHSIVSNDSVIEQRGPGQTTQMRRLILIFAVRICPDRFSHGATHILQRIHV